MRILVDGVFFQIASSGIGRVWLSLLAEWRKSGFSQHVAVLDRMGTAPRVPGVNYVKIPAHDYRHLEEDRAGLQKVCDNVRVELFVSTYYTTPLTTRSVLLVHDLIPEALGMDLGLPMWREKIAAIGYAASYVCVSQHTARELARFYPEVAARPVAVVPNGVDHGVFRPGTAPEIAGFRARHGLHRPYFLIVGLRSEYKNAILLYRAFAQYPDRARCDIVCVGGHTPLESELVALVPGTRAEPLRLGDNDLRAAYSGAEALVYPSRYEGFGLPLVEAMACGCPVITCRNSAIPEVVGEAGLYVGEDDVAGMAGALAAVREPAVRERLVAAGLTQATRFDWADSARRFAAALGEAAAGRDRGVPETSARRSGREFP